MASWNSATEGRTPWMRRNAAEFRIRESIATDQRLSVFASAWKQACSEAVVTISARDNDARLAAKALLGNVAEADWADGWRQLALGDSLLDLYPERAGIEA